MKEQRWFWLGVMILVVGLSVSFLPVITGGAFADGEPMGALWWMIILGGYLLAFGGSVVVGLYLNKRIKSFIRRRPPGAAGGRIR